MSRPNLIHTTAGQDSNIRRAEEVGQITEELISIIHDLDEKLDIEKMENGRLKDELQASKDETEMWHEKACR